MNDHTTRRDFFRSAAAAGGCLLMPGLSKEARAADESSATGTSGPIFVVTQSTSRDVNPRAAAWGYITEILDRAGLFFEQLPPSRLSSLVGRTSPIVLLAGDLQLTTAQRDVLATLVKNGGSLIGVGGASGLDEIFGLGGKRPLTEGWMKGAAGEHPVTAGLRSSLHVFGGYAVTTASGASLAEVESGTQGAKGSAIVENRFGQGRAVLLAADLIFSIVHIQQGVSVLQDGKPSPDGSALINDGELKAEDGTVLDWRRDRTAMEPDGVPIFLEPVSDELREVILRSIFHVAHQQGVTLPVLWYWPDGLKAVGHISHDTDGHDPNKAVALLEAMNRAQVKSTWCTLYPGGYPREFYGELKDQDFEIALHYDARSGGQHTSWSKQNFLLQHEWLLEEAGLEHITSNKNHYTRWEHRLDFLRWCEEVGINSDQSRGGSKQGTIGFPLGGSQPYFPIDDEADSPRLINVLEVNLLTQDLVVVCPREYGRRLLDSAYRHHGVAHFLFHPAHILKPNVADSLYDLVDYGRTKELQWWTSQQIYQWESARRGVEASFDSHASLTLRAEKPLSKATLLFLKPQRSARTILVNGRPAEGDPWSVYGFEFDTVTTDITGDVKVRIV